MNKPAWRVPPKSLVKCRERKNECLKYIKWAATYLPAADATSAVNGACLKLLMVLSRESELMAKQKRPAHDLHTMTAL